MLFVMTIFVSYYFNKPIYANKTIFIPNGSSYSIITYLNEKGFNTNFFDFLIVNLIGHPQSGWINLGKTKMTKLDFLYKLTSAKASMRTIMLIPGETYYFFLKNLSNDFNLSHELLLNAYNKYAKRKDGNILADTYELPKGMSEDKVIKYLLDHTEKRYKSMSEKLFGDYNEKKWYNYITVASIIQKESANKKEMPIVSSVIYNRLSKGMPLQMDGTLNYGQFSHTKVTPQMIANDISTYNTYKQKGIPTDPICAVEIDSIKAAVYPAVTSYFYFVKSGENKTHSFTKDFDSHKKNISSDKKTTAESSDNYQTKKADIKSIWSQ